jgi:hypothetical protein
MAVMARDALCIHETILSFRLPTQSVAVAILCSFPSEVDVHVSVSIITLITFCTSATQARDL